MADLVVTVPSGTLTLPADVIVPLASIDPAPSAGAVSSVNGQTGAVVLDAADVGAATAAQGAKADAALPAANLDTSVTTLDADAGSALRVQQDARHLSTFGPGFAVNTVAASGATEALPATYPAHNVTMDQNCEFTFPTPPTTGFSFMLRLAGAYTPTWPASVDWSGGSAPTYTSPSLYTFTTVDGGTTWLGVQAGKAFA